MEFTKEIMTKKELRAMGFPKELIEKACWVTGHEKWCFKAGPGKTAAWLFDTREFKRYLRDIAKI